MEVLRGLVGELLSGKGVEGAEEKLEKLCEELQSKGAEEVDAEELSPEDSRDIGHALQILAILCLSMDPAPLSAKSRAVCADLLKALDPKKASSRSQSSVSALLSVYRNPGLQSLVLGRGLLGPLLKALLEGGRAPELAEVASVTETARLAEELFLLQRAKGSPPKVVAGAGKLLSDCLLRSGGLAAVLRAAHSLLGTFPPPFAHHFSMVLAQPPRGAAEGHAKRLAAEAAELLCDHETPEDWAPLLVAVLRRLMAKSGREVEAGLEPILLRPLYACSCEGGLEGLALPSGEQLSRSLRLAARLASHVPPGQRPMLWEQLRSAALTLFSVAVQTAASAFPAAQAARSTLASLLRCSGGEGEASKALLQLITESESPLPLDKPRPGLIFQCRPEGISVKEVPETKSDDADDAVAAFESRVKTGLKLAREGWGGSRLVADVLAECLVQVCSGGESEAVLKAERTVELLLEGWEEELVADPGPALGGCKRLLKRVVEEGSEGLGRRAVPLVAGVVGGVVVSLSVGGLAAETRQRLEAELGEVAELGRAAERVCGDGGGRISDVLVGMEELVHQATASTSRPKDRLAQALAELSSPLPSSQGHGLILLSRLAKEKSPQVAASFPVLLAQVLEKVTDDDAYVFLNAIRCLVSLGGRRPKEVVDVLLPLFLQAPPDAAGDESLFRLRIGEAVCQLVGELGELAKGEAGRALAGGLLSLCRETEAAEVRGSALSCLGQLGGVAWPALAYEAAEVLALAEAGLGSEEAVVRSGAAALLGGLAKGGGAGLAEEAGDRLGPLYKAAVRLWAEDEDAAVRLSAQTAVDALDDAIRSLVARAKPPNKPLVQPL